MKLKLLIVLLVTTVFVACKQSAPSGSDANGVYFVNLKDGDQVKSPLVVQMGVRGMVVEPAGTVDSGKGHHHLIVDGTYIEKGQMVPKDETHLHFGKGRNG